MEPDGIYCYTSYSVKEFCNPIVQAGVLKTIPTEADLPTSAWDTHPNLPDAYIAMFDNRAPLDCVIACHMWKDPPCKYAFVALPTFPASVNCKLLGEIGTPFYSL